MQYMKTLSPVYKKGVFEAQGYKYLIYGYRKLAEIDSFDS